MNENHDSWKAKLQEAIVGDQLIWVFGPGGSGKTAMTKEVIKRTGKKEGTITQPPETGSTDVLVIDLDRDFSLGENSLSHKIVRQFFWNEISKREKGEGENYPIVVISCIAPKKKSMPAQILCLSTEGLGRWTPPVRAGQTL